MSKAVAGFQEIQDPQESHLCKLFVAMVVPVWRIHSLDWFKKGFSDLELAATAQEEANGWHMLAEIHIAEGVSRPSSTTFPDISRHTSETAKWLPVFVFLAFNFISVFFNPFSFLKLRDRFASCIWTTNSIYSAYKNLLHSVPQSRWHCGQTFLDVRIGSSTADWFHDCIQIA